MSSPDQFDSFEEYYRWYVCTNPHRNSEYHIDIFREYLRQAGFEDEKNLQKLTKYEMFDLLQEIHGDGVYNLFSVGIRLFFWTEKFEITSADMQKMCKKGFIRVVAKYQSRGGYGGTYNLYNARQYYSLTKEEIHTWLAALAANTQKRRNKKKEAEELLASYGPDALVERAKKLTRHFTIHSGPTNSGKTYYALQSLKQAKSGVYLGPLRLLALEVSDTLNNEGYPCSLLTGEEYDPVDGAQLIASTIETCSFATAYEVAVIDECQMIADPARGQSWVKAIYCVDALEVVLCTAPEALGILERMLQSFDADYDIVVHERLCPLRWDQTLHDVKQIQDGDCIVAFSRRSVLQIAAELEKHEKKASVIYGALPPAARREEVRKFNEGETTVAVCTDAIGMGVSLPIRRIIFFETQKYDGQCRRTLTTSEILQIAGRAGRYGKYPEGLVASFEGKNIIKEALEGTPAPVQKITLGFPEETLDSEYSLNHLLHAWQELGSTEVFARTNLEDALLLLAKVPKDIKMSKGDLYRYITCPVDTRNPELIQYWLGCLKAISQNRKLPYPWYPIQSLEGCELYYKALDVRHQMANRAGISDTQNIAEKEAVCKQISFLLATDKERYQKTCRYCGREISALSSKYWICNKCYKRNFLEDDFDLEDDLDEL